MELTSGYFRGITALGSLLLLDIGIHLFRASAGFAGRDYAEWGLNAALVVVIWLAYRRQAKDIGKLAGQVEEKALIRMSNDAFLTVLLAYIFLGQVLMNVRH
jgi:hypothetical protein